jgi:hypothetical protein
METLITTTKVSENGTVTLPAPASMKGKRVKIQYSFQPEEPDVPRDDKGWPIGFFEYLKANPITDPAFKRYPQGEAEPPPSFE